LPLLAVLGSWKELEDKKEPGLLDPGSHIRVVVAYNTLLKYMQVIYLDVV
jgi:hypothetical protein